MRQVINKILAALGLITGEAASAHQADYIQLASILSNGNQQVLESVALFSNNKNAYFKTHEDELLQRGIESPDELPSTIALVDSLNVANKIVYADYKEHAGDVLEQLNSLANGKLALSNAYATLASHIAEKGKHATIANYLDASDAAYLFQCVTEAGYKLVMIDEDSDAYPLALVQLGQFEVVKKLATTAGVKIKGLKKEGLKS